MCGFRRINSQRSPMANKDYYITRSVQPWIQHMSHISILNTTHVSYFENHSRACWFVDREFRLAIDKSSCLSLSVSYFGYSDLTWDQPVIMLDAHCFTVKLLNCIYYVHILRSMVNPKYKYNPCNISRHILERTVWSFLSFSSVAINHHAWEWVFSLQIFTCVEFVCKS